MVETGVGMATTLIEIFGRQPLEKLLRVKERHEQLNQYTITLKKDR